MPDIFHHASEVFVEFKFQNDRKIMESLENKVKDDDFDDSFAVINEMESLVNEMSGDLTYSEEKESDFSDATS